MKLTVMDTLLMQKCSFIMLFFSYKQVTFFCGYFGIIGISFFFENMFLFKFFLKLVFYWICDQITIIGQLFDVQYVKKIIKKKNNNKKQQKTYLMKKKRNLEEKNGVIPAKTEWLAALHNPILNFHFIDRGLNNARTNNTAREAASYRTIQLQLTWDGARGDFVVLLWVQHGFKSKPTQRPLQA